MTSKLLVEICSLFAGLFIAGSLACLPIYHWQVRKFLASRLWVKVCVWIPIFAVFCVLLYMRAWGAWAVAIGLMLQAVREISYRKGTHNWYVWAYFAVVALGLVHLPFIFTSFGQTRAAHGLIAVCFASVLSDVFAFFAGTYLGKHHLPACINDRKSYEGVAGQVVGALFGLALVAILPEIDFQWTLALGVGLASALGDIINSVVKRRLGVADWGNALPGHGGALDRFASLSFAFMTGYWVLQLIS